MEYPRYKIAEHAKDIDDTIVEKEYVATNAISVRQIFNFQQELSKTKREAQAELDIHNKEIENIEHHHKEVKELDEKTLYTHWLYYETKRKAAEMQKNLDKSITLLDQLQKEREEITTFIKSQPTPSPIQSV